MIKNGEEGGTLVATKTARLIRKEKKRIARSEKNVSGSSGGKKKSKKGDCLATAGKTG